MGTRTITLLVAAILVAAAGANAAHATPVVGAAPVFPIPEGGPFGPPPIPAMPTAGEAQPPDAEIADPVTPGAGCGGWSLQGDYGDRWPAASTWWEYRCTYENSEYHTWCTSGACPAFCDSCWWETVSQTDFFFWDGARAVFYGQKYSYSAVSEGGWWGPSWINEWWDAPTSLWYDLGPFMLTVTGTGTGSGTISSTPDGILCSYGCEANFDAGTVVTLTATPDVTSVFTGWSGDCSGTGMCEVTMAEAHKVTANFDLKPAILTVSKAGAGSGSVGSSPAGIGCGATCTATFAGGTAVALTATPDASSLFTGWSGDCSGTGTCYVTMSRARSVTATFVPIVHRPDALIRPTPTSTWIGNDVYSATGSGQMLTTSTARGATATFYIGAENDGNVMEPLSVSASGGTKGFTVRYYDGATDVTEALTSGTYSTGPLAPGASAVLRMTVTVARSVHPGTVGTWSIVVASNGFSDAVKSVVSAA